MRKSIAYPAFAAMLLPILAVPCAAGGAEARKPVVWYCLAYNTPNIKQYKIDETGDRGWSRVYASLRDCLDLRVSAEVPTAQRLAGVDLILILNPEKDRWEGGPAPRQITDEDIATLVKFVADGASLFLATNQDWKHNIEKKRFNRLLGHFGIRVGHEDIGLKVLPLPASTPSIGGLTWRFFFGSKIEVIKPTNRATAASPTVWVWNDPKAKLVEGKRGLRWPLLIAGTFGKGRVMVAADAGWTANGTIGLDDNWPILWKLLDWLTPGWLGDVPLLAKWSRPEAATRKGGAWDRPDRACRVRLSVTSELPCSRVPMDPSIDFAALLRDAGASGAFDPNSIVVVDTATGQTVPHATTEDFAYADRGRVEWVIQNPERTEFDVYFNTADKRSPLEPAPYTPLIGVGDLLRYNADTPRSIALSYLSRLVDLTGDGKRDLVGCWNYAYRPGRPWDGVVCYPRTGGEDKFEFGDLARIRYVEKVGSSDFKHLSKIYMTADFADFNNDGKIDLVYSPSGGDQLYLYLNSGQRDTGGMPVFVASGKVSRQTGTWRPCRAVDLNNDKAIDFVLGDLYLKNTNPNGWPIAPAKGVSLKLEESPCFYDVDGDGVRDAVVLVEGEVEEPRARRVTWRKNLGGDPPSFDPPQPLADIDAFWCSDIAAVNDGSRRGLLVEHDVYQAVSFYEQTESGNKPRFKRFGRAESISAVMSLSDQAWPYGCDWDDDGDLDLLVGGGYGWPRIVINEGTDEKGAYAEARRIFADGNPIRVLRDEFFGTKHWHNMGYPYPAYVDWDGDGLNDLMLPNETNRIFWYKNIGTRKGPRFGQRRQVICDGYPETPEKIAGSAKLAGDKNTPNQPYPYEEDQPFFWRTGAAFADWNGDGLMDLVTHDGHTRKATLFAQYRDAEGKLRLKKDGPLKLADGRLIDDSVVGRSKHWTESFKAADWDGDGLTDLIYSCAGTEPAKGSVYLLRNCGTKSGPRFEGPITLACFGKPIKVTAHGPNAWIGDLDGDGKPDILTCVEWSVYPFYSHVVTEMSERPAFTLSHLEKRP